jgi:hypothetical protein
MADGGGPSREIRSANPARSPVNPARPILHTRAALLRYRATTMDHRCCGGNIKGPSSWSGPEIITAAAAGSEANITCHGVGFTDPGLYWRELRTKWPMFWM